ncbi:MAG: ferritin family protein [Acidobacteria bacterium]|nr:ferritin family protein [Acidobacteriota bacterium]MCG2815534.1 ferritin family protein [Candidatus Aminicenantes bacterium]MBU1474940.1 ferritin family protein [Acidobacteriota bacterium]MBU2438514.1 ferritin family protein [Acidobacteriota bacterium]MBU4253472.1 ferritin family protein [Acidobacteriota bacterium]
MMDKRMEDILKGAILLEHKGKALYTSVLQTTEIPEIRDLFRLLAEEEDKHIAVLKKQYSRLHKGQGFDLEDLDRTEFDVSDKVLTKDLVESINGAGYEAAVISAALDFEKGAVKFYGENAEKAQAEEEKELFLWLHRWETTHLDMLAGLDRDIREQIWYDNSFWPLD